MAKTKQFPISPFLACFIEVLRIAILLYLAGSPTDTNIALIISSAIGLTIPITLLKGRANCLGPIISILLAISTPVVTRLFVPRGIYREITTSFLFTISICCNLILSEIYLSKEGGKNVRVIAACVLAAFSSYGWIDVLLKISRDNSNSGLVSLGGYICAGWSLLIYVSVIIIRAANFHLGNNKKLWYCTP